MNYAIVAFAIILVISAAQWIVDGRKNYRGPQIDMDALAVGAVTTMEGTDLNSREAGGVGTDQKHSIGELDGQRKPTVLSDGTHAKLH